MAMGDQRVGVSGLMIDEVIQRLEKWAPLSLAEHWDNVGLLIEPSQDMPIKNVMLTNDLTEDVVQEAADNEANLVITYHPNIFHGMKNVTVRNWKERIVLGCIKNNIAVFSPHTSWDNVEGGVNDWLADALEFDSSKPIQPNANNPKLGAGRSLILKNEITLSQAVESIKKHTGLAHVRLAIARGRDLESKIKTVALCAGSGISVLRGVPADLYFTGEMLHHDLLEACQSGTSVVLTNHSDSERGFLEDFQEHLEKVVLDGQIKVLVSKKDKDPLITL
ncbi:NIF3-like protein 1 isoform X2 [Coccinella septempunctata]|nr:NIF3-like protein 1 isoform X2 [Coccinella septempunctata]XP_044753130.1 NIF3-like protein 1 isoform X2 [Coccinella septempunctata]